MSEHRLPLLGGVFLLGALAGSLCCIRMESLKALLSHRVGAELAFWQVLWPDLLLLLIMMVSGFMRIGCITVLLTMAVKGFFLSSISTLHVLQMGNNGYAAALALDLFPGFLTLAALLLLGRQAMGWSMLRIQTAPGRGKRLLPDGAYLITTAICLVIILIAAAASQKLTPFLWVVLQGFLHGT